MPSLLDPSSPPCHIPWGARPVCSLLQLLPPGAGLLYTSFLQSREAKGNLVQEPSPCSTTGTKPGLGDLRQ